MNTASTFILVALAAAGMNFGQAPSANATGMQWRIEFVPTWGICGRGIIFANGTVVVEDPVPATAKFDFRGGIKASVVLQLDKHNRIAAHFRDEDGEGFELRGVFIDAVEQGQWESKSLSCGGEWRAERAGL